MNRPLVELCAQCACGATEIAVRGPIRSMFLCACTQCQKVSGAGHAAIAMTGADALTITGETKSFARPADSGATLTRHFCPVCAVTLYATSSRLQAFALLPAGLFGDMAWFAPTQVIFARSQCGWDFFPSHLAQYPAYKN